MIAVQSLWTGTKDFVLTRELALLFSASVAYLNDWWPHTELVTDMRGLEIAERLGWQHTTHATALDNLCPPDLAHVWFLGKLVASSIQSKSHFHVDLDLILMGRFRAKVEGARVAAHSKDPPGFYKIENQQEMLDLAGIPRHVTPHNTGIFLFNDLALRDAYVTAAWKAAEKVGLVYPDGTAVTVCIEQAMFSHVMREAGVKVEEVCKLPVPGMLTKDDMSTPFIHFWGRSKHSKEMLSKLEDNFAKNYPEAYGRFQRGWTLLKKAGRVPTKKPSSIKSKRKKNGPTTHHA